jgi:hypothetical protein
MVNHDTVKRLNKLYESTTSLCIQVPKLLKNVIEPLQLFITMLSLVMELDWFKCNHNGKNRKNCNIFLVQLFRQFQDLKFGGEDSLAIIGDIVQYVSA